MASKERDTNRRTIGVTANSSDSSKVHIENVHVYSKEFDYNFDLPEPIQHFTARDEEFEQLESLFFNEDTTKIQNKVVIYGIPGIGKSEFAVQFAAKCRKTGKINNVYRIKAEQESELKKSWLQIKEIYKTSEKRKTLFILDNVAGRKQLRECEFQMPNEFFFVITSQIKDWSDEIIPIELSTLNLGTCVEFYKKKLEGKYNNNDCKLLEELASFVGCIPLGLQITAAGVREYNENCIENYMNDLRKSENNFIIEGFPSSSNITYDKSLYKAIKLSLNKIKKGTGPPKSSFTFDVLYITSYFKSGMEMCLYIKELYIMLLRNIMKYADCDQNMLEKALITLDNFSLITFRNHEIIMHGFTQKMIRYHFRNYYSAKEMKFYDKCLTNSSVYEGIVCSFVLPQILQHIDGITAPIITNFLKKNNSAILPLRKFVIFRIIFESLVYWGHKNILKKMFNYFNKGYITKFGLLQIAKDSNQLDIEELLQKYLENKDSKETRVSKKRRGKEVVCLYGKRKFNLL